ncbi:MAG: hypothetical protein HQM16_03100 [Deltaproteobacteria bacterium]|nr:hypothetical protein [Deltaproteobacteria bacterium]
MDRKKNLGSLVIKFKYATNPKHVQNTVGLRVCSCIRSFKVDRARVMSRDFDNAQMIEEIRIKADTPEGNVDYHLTWEDDLGRNMRTYLMTVILDGQKEQHVFYSQILRVHEFCAALEGAGLMIDAIYGNEKREACTPDSEWQVYLLRKKD